MKRIDWLSNTSLVKPGALKSFDWSKIATEIADSLFTVTRFTKVCKADKSSIRLMLGALFYDASAHGLVDPPRPQVVYNAMAHVLTFTDKEVKVKVYTMDAAVAYEFTYRSNKLTRKQIK